MKIVYLISVYKDPVHLNRLIKSLNTNNADFIIYIDKKSKTKFDIPKRKNIQVLKSTISVFWGGFSQVKSTLELIRYAYNRDKYDYYILLSGSDYPVKSNRYISNFLEVNNGKEFINICKMPLNNKRFDRVDYYYFDGHENPLVYYLSRVLNKFIHITNWKRSIPVKYKKFRLYGGSHWWTLSHKCVQYILRFIDKNPEFVQFYKHTYIPIELFFHTIIGNSSFYKNVVNSFTYADWESNVRPLPARITENHLLLLSKKSTSSTFGSGRAALLFARKFFDDSTHVLKRIETELRKDK